MLNQMPMPIIIPSRDRVRECIIVDGKRYCEERENPELTRRQEAFVLLGLTVGAAWIMWCVVLLFDRNQPRLAAIWFFTPLAIAFIWMVL